MVCSLASGTLTCDFSERLVSARMCSVIITNGVPDSSYTCSHFHKQARTCIPTTYLVLSNFQDRYRIHWSQRFPLSCPWMLSCPWEFWGVHKYGQPATLHQLQTNRSKRLTHEKYFENNVYFQILWGEQNRRPSYSVSLAIASAFWSDNCLLSSLLLVLTASTSILLKTLALTTARWAERWWIMMFFLYSFLFHLMSSFPFSKEMAKHHYPGLSMVNRTVSHALFKWSNTAAALPHCLP